MKTTISFLIVAFLVTGCFSTTKIQPPVFPTPPELLMRTPPELSTINK